MLLLFQQLDASGKAGVKPLGVFERWTRVTVQVLTNGGTIALGDSLADISGSAIGGQVPGMQFTQAGTTTPQQIWWLGELWGIGVSAGNVMAVLYFQESPYESSQKPSGVA